MGTISILPQSLQIQKHMYSFCEQRVSISEFYKFVTNSAECESDSWKLFSLGQMWTIDAAASRPVEPRASWQNAAGGSVVVEPRASWQNAAGGSVVVEPRASWQNAAGGSVVVEPHASWQNAAGGSVVVEPHASW